LMGGLGNDTLDGGLGDDLLDENDGKAIDGVPIAGATAELNTLIGGDGVDTLFGSPGQDLLDGGAGNDLLYGRSNNDTYRFDDGYGTDQLVDYNGRETLDFRDVATALAVSPGRFRPRRRPQPPLLSSAPPEAI
jgi:Ca2+-binding RTX toxin-like protein